MLQTLKKLMPPRPAVSGYETHIEAIITPLLAPHCDSVYTDAMGNLIGVKRGTGKSPRRLLFSAHMDEIGFIVTFIEDNGYIRVAPIGGIDFAAAQFSEVVFENGTRGVLVPEADEKGTPKAEKCYVDIGAADKKAAERHVKVGDTLALPATVRRLLGSRVCGRPLDNRIGCAVLLRLAAEVKKSVDDIYFVFSVQEEVGCRGARPASFGIAPDTAIIFDVTATGDAIGDKPMAVKLGAGAAVKIKDMSVICHAGLVDELLTAAKNADVAVQSEILTRGGTDTSAMQMTGAGCRAGAISIPCRYIHSGVEMLDLRDAEAALSLAKAWLEERN